MPKKNLVLISIGLILVLIITYYNYAKPILFEKTYDGIMYSTENKFEKKTKISLKGDIYRNGFQEDLFQGDLIVDNIKHNIKMKKQNGKFMGVLTSINSNGNTLTIGSIQTSSDLSMIWLNLKELDDKYNLKLYVSAPANNMQEGNNIAEKILIGK